MAQMTFKGYGLFFNSAGEKVARAPVFSFSADIASISSDVVTVYIEGVTPSDYDFSQITHSYVKKQITLVESTPIPFESMISTKIFPAFALGMISDFGNMGDMGICYVCGSETSMVQTSFCATGNDWSPGNTLAFFYNEFDGRYALAGISDISTSRPNILFDKNWSTYQNHKVTEIVLEDTPQVIQKSPAALLLGYQMGMTVRRMRGQKGEPVSI